MSGIEIASAVEDALGVAIRIYSVYSKLRDAPEEIREFCNLLESLLKVLISIGMSVSRLKNTRSFSGKVLGPGSVLAALHGCEAEFNAIWRVISPLRMERDTKWKDALTKLSRSARWALKEEDIAKSAKRFQGWEQSLVLAMLGCGIDIDMAVLERVSLVGIQVNENGNAIETQVQHLEVTLIFCIRKQEEQILQRIEELSGRAIEQHNENDRRLDDLSGALTRQTGTQSPTETSDTPLETHFEVFDVSGGDQIPGMEAVPSSELAAPRNGISNGSSNLPVHTGTFGRTERDPMSSPNISLESSIKAESFHEIPALEEAMRLFARSHGGEDTAFDVGELGFGQSSALRETLTKFSEQMDKISSHRAGSLIQRIIPRLDSPEVVAFMFPAMKMLLESFAAPDSHFENILEAIQEMQDAFEVCEREYALFPAPRIKSLIVGLYNEGLSSIAQIYKFFNKSQLRMVMAAPAAAAGIRLNTEKIKSFSQKVIREVECLHRKELREAHMRLLEVDRKQDEVLRALKEQQAILASVQDEQKLLGSVADYQRVLQQLQELLARAPKFPDPVAMAIDVLY